MGEVIYKKLGAILAFLVITFVIQTVFGEKIARGSCILILISMLLYRSEAISNIVKQFV